MKKNYKGRRDLNDKMTRIMVIHSDDKNWNVNDFYPMQNWTIEERQLWQKTMLKKKILDS